MGIKQKSNKNNLTKLYTNKCFITE